MARIALFLLTTSCIGTRDVEPEWEYDEEEELVVETCGGDDTGTADGFAISGSIKAVPAAMTPAARRILGRNLRWEGFMPARNELLARLCAM